MTAATAARRLPVLAIVAAAHALALALLFELTRTHRLGAVVEESLTLVDLAPAVRPRPLEPPATRPSALTGGERAIAPPRETRPPPSPPSRETGSAAIDWAAEGADAAARVALGEDAPRPKRTFGMPSPSAMFDPGPARRRGFAWNHAHTHRVEALPGGVTVFNLNDHCAIALIWIVPAFGCSIGKMPVRSDLFEHMRDLKGRKEPDWP
jgi:hypothetical protein